MVERPNIAGYFKPVPAGGRDSLSFACAVAGEGLDQALSKIIDAATTGRALHAALDDFDAVIVAPAEADFDDMEVETDATS
jgi:hypothetical protein